MKFKKCAVLAVTSVLAASCAMGLAGCGGGPDTGSGKGGDGYTTVVFWGGGDRNETKVFGDLVNTFNSTVGKEKKIRVQYSSGHEDYDGEIANQLTSEDPPDVLYVPDRQFKSWANSLYLAYLTDREGNPLPDYEGLDEFLVPGKIWDQGINRYRYDPITATSNTDDILWALPKDIGPSVLYYNRKYLEELDIEHISVDIGSPEFIEKGYPEKGYFEMDGQYYFNNRVPMSWEEIAALGTRMQKEINALNINGHDFDCKNGYFTEWWFNYGWGVGGDCVEYVSEGVDEETGKEMGYYRFTLNDTTVNWIVKDNCAEGVELSHEEGGKTITTHYNAGEVISYADKTENAGDGASVWQAKCNQLPSMMDAFLEFVSLTAKEGADVGVNSDGVTVKGKELSLGQNATGTQSARDRFVAGTIGMFVGLRAEVTHLRQKIGEQGGWMTDSDSWDVAPLPMYKKYDSDGKVTVHGVQAGHSGSMGLAIAYGSKHKKEAWELVKYIAGPEGQTAQSLAGFCIPNQIELANSAVFLQSDQAPKNSQVFVDAAAYERPADWWYLPDWHWIDDWADALNNRVREPDSADPLSVEQLFKEYGDSTQELLYDYTFNSHHKDGV